MLEALTPQPQDAILALMSAFREDPREAKIDLGVGVYRDAGGNTPIMRAVKAAERRIWEAQDTKVYTGLAGDPAFAAALRDLVLGEAAADRVAVIATPGGTGAVHKGLELARMASPDLTVHLPDPTWPNHAAILRHLGIPVRTYRYFDAATGGVDVEGMLEDLAAARPGDVVLVHGCCHNPTGADPAPEDWERIAGAIEATGATAMVDLAYQGFGEGLDADAAPARLLAARLPEVLIAASCSKNFGIYRERTGALIAVSGSAGLAQEAMAALNRLNYSFPPDHGARIVQTILGDEALAADWRAELDEVRGHMIGLREALAAELRQRTNSDRFDFLARHRGMFSRLGTTPEQVERLRAEHGIYMVGDGRINVAGSTPRRCPCSPPPSPRSAFSERAGPSLDPRAGASRAEHPRAASAQASSPPPATCPGAAPVPCRGSPSEPRTLASAEAAPVAGRGRPAHGLGGVSGRRAAGAIRPAGPAPALRRTRRGLAGGEAPARGPGRRRDGRPPPRLTPGRPPPHLRGGRTRP